MDKEISSTKDKPNYFLCIICLLLPTVLLICGSLADGEFVAIGSYVLSYGGNDTYLLWSLVITLIWPIGGIVSLCAAIASLLIRKCSRRKRIVALCALAGYVLAFTWICCNPIPQQIKRAFYGSVPIDSSPTQVMQILSSKNIISYKNKDILYAYIPEDGLNSFPYLVTFHFVHHKFTYLTVEHPQDF